jgi:hypothetical protein
MVLSLLAALAILPSPMPIAPGREPAGKASHRPAAALARP